MKKLTLTAIVLLFSLNLFCRHAESILYTEPEKIRGSGNLVSEVRTTALFHSVNFMTAGKVNITQGQKQVVSVTADDNIIEHVITSARNGSLMISIEPDIQLTNMSLTVDITMTDIEELTTSSAGSIEGKNKFTADVVRLNLFSAGSISLDIEADLLISSLLSAGSLYLSGTVSRHLASINSAGSLHAFTLMSDTTIVAVTSAGSAEVYASRFLDVTLTSIGSVYYIGNPVISQTITSLGRLFDAN